MYQKLAGKRDFYDFFAAGRLSVPYKLGNHPAHTSPCVLQRVHNTAGIRRAMEFFNHDKVISARRGWYHTARLFDHGELAAQVRLVYDTQRHSPVIRSISQTQYWDDLDIRFPMAHRVILVHGAKDRGLHSNWIFTIVRQGSASISDARSGVGATRLTQLTPGAAKEISRKFGIPLTSAQRLIVPDVNIRLGAAYLSQVRNQFNDNRVPTSAAYNAGSGRVCQWLKGTHHLAFDMWIETIPFDETRQYMQSVPSYVMIYGQKLNVLQPIVDWHERHFDDL